MGKRTKALEIENAINKFAGGDWNITNSGNIVRNFKDEIAIGLLGLQCRNLISKSEEIELFNTIKNCNDNFEVALTEYYDIECIEIFIKKLKSISCRVNKEFEQNEI